MTAPGRSARPIPSSGGLALATQAPPALLLLCSSSAGPFTSVPTRSVSLFSGAALTPPAGPASPQDASPGPIYFLDPKVTRFGRSCTPAYSMQGRGKSRGLEVTPGPGAYSPEKVAPVRQRTPPAFTLGSRLRPQLQDTSAPAPNTYTLPSLWGSQILTKPSSPSYTAAGRTPPARPPQDPAEIPGPGQYESPDPNTYRQRRPAFTILGRPRAPRPPEETPGPGTHRPEQATCFLWSLEDVTPRPRAGCPAFQRPSFFLLVTPGQVGPGRERDNSGPPSGWPEMRFLCPRTRRPPC
ncbi:outer dense fiber protein 3-like protein 2 isoform X3 [Canis lupus familiaris]|uniref:outer dense fiber protein 3-like protein 2 isoform X3 n=1 Tax=Canis lupus familiaris TaxID=9615 RepID=UPI000BAA3328|nr:outer dense fiber protein 3-like protein 2 isoform X3 [Canis lupus familiaris]|eukprot:XP_022263029.1 outer dense fiber protein 3-like protein 2 isoform X1 [Canis lupus familiaris]